MTAGAFLGRRQNLLLGYFAIEKLQQGFVTPKNEKFTDKVASLTFRVNK